MPREILAKRESVSICLGNGKGNEDKQERCTGRWSGAEHEMFIEGIKLYGNRRWKEISTYMKTRNAAQVRICHSPFKVFCAIDNVSCSHYPT